MSQPQEVLLAEKADINVNIERITVVLERIAAALEDVGYAANHYSRIADERLEADKHYI